MKIAILIPAYKVMETRAVESLVAMMADIHNSGDCYVPIFCHGAFIEFSRYVLSKAAVASAGDAEYALWLDSDHIYKASHLYRLVAEMEAQKLDMLSAAYVTRSTGDDYAHALHRPGMPAGNYSTFPCTGELEGVVEVDVVGFGFMVMKMGFLKEMFEKHGPALFATRFEDGKLKQGDDVRFCELAKSAGRRIAFHAGVKVGHLAVVER